MRAEGEERHALIVATARYDDPKLQQLRAPAADAERLAGVLGDPDRGDFHVDVLVDATNALLTRRIAAFFRDRRPQDLLLLHFSCHGVKDDRGELYLAATDTELDLLSATGVSAGWLNDQISRTRSRRTVVLLDCCFSGSFPFGMRARGSGVDAPEHLQGRGRAIITASNAMEYAYEGDELQGEGRPSVFTEAVVDGLATGRADLDNDHLVSVDDLYNYVYDRVKDATPSQTPSRKSDLEGPLYLARSAYRREVTPATLDADLLTRTEDRYAGVREGAAQELAALLQSRDPGVALAARHALARMLDDDSRRVSARAGAALAAAHAEAAVPAAGASRPEEDAAVPAAGASRPEEDAAPPSAGAAVAGGDHAPAAGAAVPDADQAPAREDTAALGAGAAPPPPAPGRRRRRRWPLPAAAATVAGLAGALAVVLTAGDGDPPSKPGVPAFNLTANPSFERNAEGWTQFKSRIEPVRAPDAPAGERVARVRLATTPREYAIDDEPPTVRTSVEGRTYTASAWVKATPRNDGAEFCIAIREQRPGDEKELAGTYAAVQGSAGAYRRLRVSHRVVADGRRVDVHVFRNAVDEVHPGEAFFADAIALVEGPPARPSGECHGA